MRTLEVERFSLKDTLECGQTFCWIKEGKGYINADIGQVVYVEQRGNTLHYETSHVDVDLQKMFRLHDPLEEIQQEISRDGIMRASIEFAPELRIIGDPFYPTLVSFLCSVWKNIPAIRGMTNSIRREWGPSYELRGSRYYGMPTPQELSIASVKDLKKLGLAWRADFISKSTEAIIQGEVSETSLREMKYVDAHREVKKLHGVGNKVADCMCLFSLGFLEAFPIDVWIERVIQEHYDVFSETGKSYMRKSEAARMYFGKYAGYAQEYLYHYSRCAV
ncbi:MAG: DNA-3-methyladenine glycosylase family protein [Candidatus Thorarchaeota archaeon]|jgi:N-glycosylase/DNA lyase